MSKKYDEIIKLPCDKLAQAMSDITYLYEETRVPKKHYKQFMEERIEEQMEEAVSSKILDVYVKTIKQIIDDSPIMFIKALMCVDKGINPLNMRPYEQQAINASTLAFIEGKKKVQYLDSSAYVMFDDIIKHGTEAVMELLANDEDTDDDRLN